MDEKKIFSFACIDWDQNDQPLSTEYDDVYFSRANGLEESRYVFIQHNQLKERWVSPSTNFSSNEFVIGETGFGTGLNFLATWQLWEAIQKGDTKKTHLPSHKKLHFISVEKHPLQKEDLKRSLAIWPELQEYSNKLLAVYDDYPSFGFKQYYVSDSVTLTLIIDDATDGFNQLIESDHPWFRKPINNAHGVDAWFLDGFSPSKNPDMWNSKLFTVLAELSHSKTTLSTFTAAGFVKRGLQAAGFSVQKKKGFAHKRELITGNFNIQSLDQRQLDLPDCKISTITSPYPVPWHVQDDREKEHDSQKTKAITVIGAGIAGCFTANALARKGWTVTVLDSSTSPASAASGNPQGIIYGKLSKDSDWLAQLNLASLPFAEQFYNQFWRQKPGNMGQQCGVLQLAHNTKEINIINQLNDFFCSHVKNNVLSNENIQFLSPEKASQTAGIPIDYPAIYFPKLGWINPPNLCKVLLSHANITFKNNTSVNKIQASPNNDHNVWTLYNKENDIINHATHIVICNASDANRFFQSQQLPLKNIRGQISQIHQSAIQAQGATKHLPLKSALCSDGYIAPPNDNGEFTLGATFTLHNNDLSVTDEDNKKNLSSIIKSIPSLKNDLEPIQLENVKGRTGNRCTTPDYLPIVGALHNHHDFIEDYSLLKKNANASIPLSGSFFKRLYINVGYGSRGLAYAPLCSEYLAAHINGDIWPISRSLATALNPGRFTIRDLIRNKL